jgi:hypothetical protein
MWLNFIPEIPWEHALTNQIWRLQMTLQKKARQLYQSSASWTTDQTSISNEDFLYLY